MNRVWGALLLTLIWSAGAAQIGEPRRLQLGMALGMGGLHTVLKPSFDLHFHHTSLRLAPGLFFFSVGVEQRFSFNRQREYNKGRKMLVSFSYHDDWLLMKTKRALFRDDKRRDLKMFMLLLGFHYPLDPRGKIYCDVSVGPMLTLERYHPTADGAHVNSRVHVYPMMELRVGGIFTDRRYFRQKL